MKIYFNKKFSNTFLKFSKKYFSMPLTFKNKINNFFKFVHPDVLGRNCPEEIKQINEKSMQEINLYIDSLDKGLKFENKTIEFFIEVQQKDDKGDFISSYTKYSVDLDSISPDNFSMNKLVLKNNLSSSIDNLIKKITKIKHLGKQGKFIDTKNEKEESEENIETNFDELLTRPKKYNTKQFLDEAEIYKRSLELDQQLQRKRMQHLEKKMMRDIDKSIHSQTDFFLTEDRWIL